jgi:hypothetical protein
MALGAGLHGNRSAPKNADLRLLKSFSPGRKESYTAGESVTCLLFHFLESIFDSPYLLQLSGHLVADLDARVTRSWPANFTLRN